MIKDNQKFFNRLHVVVDAVVIAGSYLLAWWLMFGSWFADKSIGVLHVGIYLSALYFVVPGYLILYSGFRLYAPKRVQRTENEILNILKANVVGITLFLAVLFLANSWFSQMKDFSRSMLALFAVLNTVNSVLVRALIRRLLHLFRKKGYNLKHILLVGYSSAAEGFVDRVKQNPEWGYQIRGILDDKKERGSEYNGIRIIGSIDDLDYILEQNALDEIAITLSLGDYEKLRHIVALCEKSGVHTKFIPDYGNIIPTVPYMEDLQGLPVIHIRHVPLNNMSNAAVKRAVDIFGSIVGIILFSPIMLIVAVLIKLSSPGPVIYCQERVGLHNRPFKMYKFRSMTVQDPGKEKSRWTTRGDSRVTPIGKLIRKTSIDETPQFFNILKGDMSLVGPRPERPFFVEKFKEEIPRYMIKHQVRPGLTGWAQVNGYRGDTSIMKRIEHDLYYIENWSLGFDFKILFLTVFKGFINKNAY